MYISPSQQVKICRGRAADLEFVVTMKLAAKQLCVKPQFLANFRRYWMVFGAFAELYPELSCQFLQLFAHKLSITNGY